MGGWVGTEGLVKSRSVSSVAAVYPGSDDAASSDSESEALATEESELEESEVEGLGDRISTSSTVSAVGGDNVSLVVPGTLLLYPHRRTP